MKRIILRSIKSKTVVKTLCVEDKDVEPTCAKLSADPRYGAVLIDYEFEIADVEEEEVSAMEYLEETEWYFIRFLEIGTPIPKDIAEARKKAWVSIKDTEVSASG